MMTDEAQTQPTVLDVQAAMLEDLTPEQRVRYDAIMNPHADCPHAPYCAVDHL